MRAAAPLILGAVESKVAAGLPLSFFDAMSRDGIDRTIRVIRPGEAVTMDYNPEWLNVLVDAQDRVVRVSCG